ncbi:MAG: VWA domain-containing protein [Lachnospiraceae bacterium]|jgi:secreted protein with Ig-like and vWFA domain|nr:VWA domain-containing protein [Lachnospiraceae bacterium]
MVQLRKNEEELTKEIMGKISLSKDKVNLEKHVVNLTKCVVDLSKKSNIDLGSAKAKVVVVLDYSGSMCKLYSNGTVQKTINRLVPLGLSFDDNGSIDVYLFQNDYRKLEDLDLSNYEDYVKTVVNTAGYSMGGTNYAPVLRAIIEGSSYKEGGFLGFGAKTVKTEALVDKGDPTFILFITDGANADRLNTDNIIKKSSEMNVFIQFIGIGKEKFDYLMKLDNISGRKRDNTGFSKMKDLDKASDHELYTNVLEQFSRWLKGMQ